jgi:hypothetical protein
MYGSAIFSASRDGELPEGPDELRRKADRCRRLTRTVNNPEVVALLEELAREYERRADAIDGGTRRAGDMA